MHCHVYKITISSLHVLWQSLPLPSPSRVLSESRFLSRPFPRSLSEDMGPENVPQPDFAPQAFQTILSVPGPFSADTHRLCLDAGLALVRVCVYYSRTYDKAVCGGGRGTVVEGHVL